MDEVAAKRGALTGEELRAYDRFVNRTRWVPRSEDLAVDSWTKSALTRVVHMIMQRGNDDSWDELGEHDVRAAIHTLLTDFDSWMGGLRSTTYFWENLEESGMRVYNARFGDPLAKPRTRTARLRSASREAWHGLRAAWKGSPR